MAQTGTSPAEIPPTSFKGRQFIDSQGCVFLRAGIDGNIYWVPRMNTARQPICGQNPTVFEGQDQPVSVAPDVPVIDVTPDVPLVVADVDVETATPVNEGVERLEVPVATETVPEPDIPVYAEGTLLPEPVSEISESEEALSVETETKTETETEIVSIPAKEIRPKPKPKLKRKPKRANQDRQAAAARVQTKASPKVERVIPKHIAIDRQNSQNLAVPKGYRRVWEDDRLNPKRAEQTLAGHRKMNLIWTATVPRRLINQVTGEDMTQKLALVYPFTDKAKQRRELGKVTLEHRDGKVIKRIKRRVAKTKTAAPQQIAKLPKDVTQYVQVGAFANPANANRAARLLEQNGLNVRMVPTGRSGKPLKLVLAGPFQNAQDAQKAVRAARTAGFHDAFIRN